MNASKRSALNGSDPIIGAEAARRLGMSHQRFYQIVRQLYRARDRACPLAGIWMPQIDAANWNGWTDAFAPDAKAAIQAFLGQAD